MDTRQTNHFTLSFQKFLRTHRGNFQFTLEEWLAFWNKRPLMADRAAFGSRQVIVARLDAKKPWTPTNTIAKRKVFKRVTQSSTPAGPAQQPYPDARRLTVKQWLDEVRG